MSAALPPPGAGRALLRSTLARRTGWALLTAGVGAVVLDGGLFRHRALAGPLAIARALGHAATSGTLSLDVGATALRTMLGVALGAVLGLIVARPLARREARREGTLDFLRAIPPLLVLPLFCFALGYGEAARVLVVAWAAALTVSLHVGAALARPAGERERALVAMGASDWQVLCHLRSRELVPPLVLGVRQAVATGLVVSVVAEMVIGAEHGLGARAVAAQIAYDTPGLWGVLVTAGALGWGAGRGLLALEARVAHLRAG